MQQPAPPRDEHINIIVNKLASDHRTNDPLSRLTDGKLAEVLAIVKKVAAEKGTTDPATLLDMLTKGANVALQLPSSSNGTPVTKEEGPDVPMATKLLLKTARKTCAHPLPLAQRPTTAPAAAAAAAPADAVGAAAESTTVISKPPSHSTGTAAEPPAKRVKTEPVEEFTPTSKQIMYAFKFLRKAGWASFGVPCGTESMKRAAIKELLHEIRALPEDATGWNPTTEHYPNCRDVRDVVNLYKDASGDEINAKCADFLRLTAAPPPPNRHDIEVEICSRFKHIVHALLFTASIA